MLACLLSSPPSATLPAMALLRRLVRVSVFMPAMLGAQAPPPGPIDDEALVRTIEARCATLLAEGKLARLDDLHAAPPPTEVALGLAPARTARLEPEEVYTLGRASAVLVGVYYHCEECDAWHFDAASGVALTKEGAVATCWHVLERDPERADARGVIADYEGRVWPVRAVLAANVQADVCIVATDARELVPMPLRVGARVGERVFCLSNPDHRFGFFSEGLLARWFVDREPPPDDEKEASTRALQPGWPAFEVTLDFAQGSSGAAILDRAGNAVALAQATQTIVTGAVDEPGDVQMVVKVAAPAAALQALIRAPK